MYGYPKGRCSWLSQLNVVLGMVATYMYRKLISTKKSRITEKHTEGRLPVVKASGKICYPGRLGSSWHPREYLAVHSLWYCVREVPWLHIAFSRLSFSLRQIQATNNILKNFHVRTCKVSWVINTLETTMGCWKERHFTYKCKSFATVPMTV